MMYNKIYGRHHRHRAISAQLDRYHVHLLWIPRKGKYRERYVGMYIYQDLFFLSIYMMYNKIYGRHHRHRAISAQLD